MTTVTNRTYGTFNDYPSGETAHYPVSCANRTMTTWGPWATSLEPLGEVKIVSSQSTPEYWKKRKRGERLPSNPFMSFRHTRMCTGYSEFYTQNVAASCTPPLFERNHYRGRYWAYYVTTFGLDIPDLGLISPSQRSSSFNKAATRCHAKRGSGKANFLESLAEMDQAWRMMRSPGENLRKFLDTYYRQKAYRTLQRGQSRFPRPRGKSIASWLDYYKRLGKEGQLYASLLSSEWLRFRFGVQPLLNDYQAAVKILSKGHAKTAKLFSSVETEQITEQRVQQKSKINGNYEYVYTHAQTSVYSVRCKITDAYEKSIWNDAGFNWQNFMGLPWELTRLSFIVDRFANIGDILYANFPRVELTTVGASSFIVESDEVVCAPGKIVSLQPTISSVVGGLSEVSQHQYMRKTRMPLVPGPSLVLSTDGFGADNWKWAVDNLALIQQGFKRLLFP